MINRNTFVFLLGLYMISACAPMSRTSSEIEKHIVAHPQYNFNDRIDGIGWEPDTEVSIEIDDPGTETRIDFSDSQSVSASQANTPMITFFTGDSFDLKPGDIITLTDGKITIRHVVRDISITSIDIENDTFTGTAQPGSELMVWVEAPYSHEIRTIADANGNWSADFTEITDIIPSSNGAVAQNDDPNSSSHTRINWNFDLLHLEVSLVDDQIGFYDFHPFGSVTFRIFNNEGGQPILEGSLETDELGHVMFFNEDRSIDMRPGMVITAKDDTSGKEISLVLSVLSIEKVDLESNVLSGSAAPQTPVEIHAYDLITEDEYIMLVISDSDGEWVAEFEEDLHEEMELYAYIFDEEHDHTSARWISE